MQVTEDVPDKNAFSSPSWLPLEDQQSSTGPYHKGISALELDSHGLDTLQL